jgi:hypothetical protein
MAPGYVYVAPTGLVVDRATILGVVKSRIGVIGWLGWESMKGGRTPLASARRSAGEE